MEQTKELSTVSNNLPIWRAESRISLVTKQWPTIKHFMQDYPPQFVARAGRMAMDCMTNDNHPSLLLMTKAFGYEKTQAWIMTQLTIFNEQFITDRRMTPFQIEMCASMLIDNFPTLTCAELSLCLNRILSGKYGNVFYGAIEYTKITAILNGEFKEEVYRVREEAFAEEERRKRDAQFSDGMTWEEYCKKNGKDPADNPLLRIQNATHESSQRVRLTKTRMIPKVGETAEDRESFEEKRKKFMAGFQKENAPDAEGAKQ